MEHDTIEKRIELSSKWMLLKRWLEVIQKFYPNQYPRAMGLLDFMNFMESFPTEDKSMASVDIVNVLLMYLDGDIITKG